jgi:predicted nucleic acid-binding protein
MSSEKRRMLDTNMLVRYFMGTPTDQYQKAAALIDSDDPLWLSVVTILEAAHVLRRIYSIPRDQVVDGLTDLLRRLNLHVCELPRQRIMDALALCRPSGRVSFGDALIWARAAEDDAAVLTFDQRFPSQGITVTAL